MHRLPFLLLVAASAMYFGAALSKLGFQPGVVIVSVVVVVFILSSLIDLDRWI